MDELANVKGRGWEDVDVSAMHYAAEMLMTDHYCSIERQTHSRLIQGSPARLCAIQFHRLIMIGLTLIHCIDRFQNSISLILG